MNDLDFFHHTFVEVGLNLAKLEWFRPVWLSRVGYYPKDNPDVASMHVYKPNWFNDDGRGIHFETFAGPKEAREKYVPLMIHIFPTPVVPGTRIKRIRISRPFIDSAESII